MSHAKSGSGWRSTCSYPPPRGGGGCGGRGGIGSTRWGGDGEKEGGGNGTEGSTSSPSSASSPGEAALASLLVAQEVHLEEHGLLAVRGDERSNVMMNRAVDREHRWTTPVPCPRAVDTGLVWDGADRGKGERRVEFATVLTKEFADVVVAVPQTYHLGWQSQEAWKADGAVSTARP